MDMVEVGLSLFTFDERGFGFASGHGGFGGSGVGGVLRRDRHVDTGGGKGRV